MLFHKILPAREGAQKFEKCDHPDSIPKLILKILNINTMSFQRSRNEGQGSLVTMEISNSITFASFFY